MFKGKRSRRTPTHFYKKKEEHALQLSYFRIIHLDFLRGTGEDRWQRDRASQRSFWDSSPDHRRLRKEWHAWRKNEGRGKGISAEWKSSQPWCLVGLNLLEGICECGFCKDRDYWDEVRCPFQHATHRNPAACSNSTVVTDFLRTLWHYQNSAEIMTSPPFRRMHDIIKTLPGMVSIRTLHWQLHRWP